MTSLLEQELAPLNAQIEKILEKREMYEERLGAVAAELEKFTDARQRFDALQDVCDALDKLVELNAGELFWKAIPGEVDAGGHLKRVRGRVARFEDKICGIQEDQAHLQWQVDQRDEELAFLYEQVVTVENQLAVSTSSVEYLLLGAASIEALRLFKLSLAKGKLNRQALVLVFDLDGLLRAKTFGTWRANLGRGFGFNVIFQAVPLVKTAYLRNAPDQHGWGKSLLEPLPITLNAGQSLATGRSGLELRGTSTAVGQHTLELRR